MPSARLPGPVNSRELDLTVIMPALNEEKSLVEAITSCLKTLDEFRIDAELIVINDGSTDGTGRIIENWRARDARVGMIVHERPRGIGAAFWEGVDAARSRCVVMLPGDNENDPREIIQYLGILDHVDVVIPFVFNKEVRSLFRNALSYAYRFIVNTTFLVNFNYTNGTNLYRTSVLRQLKHRSRGFFFQTDILIRLVKRNYLFAEVPYRLGVRKYGVSRSSTFPSFLQVVRGYLRLVKDIYWNDKDKTAPAFTPDSATGTRRRAPDALVTP